MGKDKKKKGKGAEKAQERFQSRIYLPTGKFDFVLYSPRQKLEIS